MLLDFLENLCVPIFVQFNPKCHKWIIFDEVCIMLIIFEMLKMSYLLCFESRWPTDQDGAELEQYSNLCSTVFHHRVSSMSDLKLSITTNGYLS